MLMYDSFRGTNQFGSVHKDPVTSVGGWNTGVKMPVPLLGKKRHRHNQRVAKMCRLGYPKISRYDVWLIEEVRSLYMLTHGILLYPNVKKYCNIFQRTRALMQWCCKVFQFMNLRKRDTTRLKATGAHF